ncbi:MAG: DUF2807 domain-containing protein [Hyphomonadaceae bacterium JAD_PAG50586_4]|nr:MAG: DUF2807 domain-containing protein [Hyphomonadaceae bacterium JAD_PAG50586_4]
MKRALAVTLVALALAAPASAETRNLRGFTAINVSDGIDLDITASSPYAIEVTGRDAARVETVVEDGTLRIRQRNRSWFGRNDLDANVRVNLPHLNALAASRGVSVAATGIEAETFDLSAAMGADVRVAGTCGALDLSAAMGASVRAGDLHCRTADVSAAMGADARIFVTETYEGSASMGASINVAGDGASRGRSTAMGGSITD